MAENDRPTFTADDEQGAREAAEAVAVEQGEPRDTEAIARRAEKLMAKAQELLSQVEVETADQANLRVEREVRQALNELNEVYVSNAQTDLYHYAWVYRDPGNQFGGRYVRRMQAQGWEVVQGKSEPEAQEHLFVDGTRVVADCLLMRIRLDRKMLLEKRDRLIREAQQAGIVSRVYEMAERAGTRVYDRSEIEALSSGPSNTAIKEQARASFHRMNATGKIDRMLRGGTIPGRPAPGAGSGS